MTWNETFRFFVMFGNQHIYDNNKLENCVACLEQNFVFQTCNATFLRKVVKMFLLLIILICLAEQKNDSAEEAEEVEEAHNSDDGIGGDDGESSTSTVKKTHAERAYEKAQEKRAAERILKKASKTHKQRVEELNEYLGDLSEHYDIQKVSWTK